jgi:hypothetical protein
MGFGPGYFRAAWRDYQPSTPAPCAGCGQKKEPLESGSEKFGRGCLKGTVYVRPHPLWCKCETDKTGCEKRNCSIFAVRRRQSAPVERKIMPVKQHIHTYA